MIKKHLALLVLLTALTLLACSKDPASEGLEYTLTEDKTYAVTDIGTCLDDEIIIPSEYKGKKVTAIGEDAFANASRPESITIPHTVTTIGEGAFRGCDALRSIHIPDSVTKLGASALADCPDLTAVTLGDGLVTIEEQTFHGCAALSSVTMGKSVESIQKQAFASCSSLTSITLPEGLKTLGREAFLDCFHLAEVINLSAMEIEPGSESYGQVAFYATEVHTGDTHLITDGDFIFYSAEDKTYLVAYTGSSKNLPLPADHRGAPYAIRRYAFLHRSDLASVTIPEGITEIGEEAFKGCSGLTEITVPATVTRMGQNAFESCDSLTSLTLPFVGENRSPGTNHQIGHLFGGRGNTNLPSSLRTVTVHGDVAIDSQAFFRCAHLQRVILDGVTTVGPSAFASCPALTEVVFTESLTEIGDDAFSSCPQLTAVFVPGDGVLDLGGGAFEDCTSLTSAFIKDGAARIGAYTFFGCRSLTETNAAETATEIEDFAFSGCSKLTHVTLSEALTSIGQSAFFGCSSLTFLTIPESTVSLGNSAFHGCERLADVYYPGTAAQWRALAREDIFSSTPPRVHYNAE